MFAKVENGVTKSYQFFRQKNRKTQFWPESFLLIFEQDRLLFARVDIGVTEFPTKAAEKEEEKNGSEIIFQKWVRIPFRA